MKCAKVQLQERSKLGPKEVVSEKPRRFCQRRLVDPDHEEDTRWRKYLEGYYNYENQNLKYNQAYSSSRNRRESEDLFLSVQNLQFHGEIQQIKRPRTSFKYKTLPHQQHRMFVKELVEDDIYNDSGHFSELTCYYYDDYAKYLINNDQSRTSSGKSSLLLYSSDKKSKDNVNVKSKRKPKTTKSIKKYVNTKKPIESRANEEQVLVESETPRADTKIAYHKCGKRKSLTISRAESPATLQVIRVDVVCNYSCSTSAASEYEDKKQTKSNEKAIKEKNEIPKEKQLNFANKYLLTNTVKTLDENAGGARVTLLCKTFQLADRSGLFAENKAKSLKNKRN